MTFGEIEFLLNTGQYLTKIYSKANSLDHRHSVAKFHVQIYYPGVIIYNYAGVTFASSVA